MTGTRAQARERRGGVAVGGPACIAMECEEEASGGESAIGAEGGEAAGGNPA